jgi:dienelactone hydrolase
MHDPKILARTITGRAILHLPQGQGPFPAVIVMEGLGGLKKSRELWYGKFLAENGYAALVVDSFGARGAAGYMHNIRAMMVTEAMLLADAFAALAFMRAQPVVRPDSIAIFGFSYGGMISVLTAYKQIRDLYLGRNGAAFAGHVAYYGCSVPRLEDPTTTGAPLLLQIGEFDRNVSVQRTRSIVEDLGRGGSPVDLVVYENTFHQWDGADVKKRFVQFALPDTRIHVGRDYSMRDERTGMRVTGRLSRAAAILASVDPRGYHILRDESIIAESNQRTLSFLRSLSERNEQDQAPLGLREGSFRPARRANSPR